jgi:hypothetical protein
MCHLKVLGLTKKLINKLKKKTLWQKPFCPYGGPMTNVPFEGSWIN